MNAVTEEIKQLKKRKMQSFLHITMWKMPCRKLQITSGTRTT